ncbi:Six-hairpin glycosidase [Eremomyces bilateralis CBS 781.70]|uniref:Six-hairpin glycosidase n=1 Tax=Eremomyces bilateralis CBS 781.70 TaxID=1392243 RepID=A0A6G1FUS2_9PEZI|nr:Six-hairpin glycosidase [Eremomyces bilateralis CBS 781.70]KAF1809401.1 Six-hairpin glycosidase [Eremomyces bilateralis CBS 781.70]
MGSRDPVNALQELHYALETMQDNYFELWAGLWPAAIDWTAAVLGTHMSASLYSLTNSFDYILPPPSVGERSLYGERVENEINKYFTQTIASYFGQNDFELRFQGYDDMLWVVLGWLESLRFIKFHSTSHYDPGEGGTPWYGQQFEPAFNHRARIFYELSETGWDTELCGGGMKWANTFPPYKNAITNELFVAASVGMYLYFTGDKNPSPLMNPANRSESASADAITSGPYDPKFRDAAITAYDWLKNSKMTNAAGLYTDGFHIRDYGKDGTIGTGKCDERNEMVYTYNQGVILSGLRGLWEATGNVTYLEDGHHLVRNVMKATGWTGPTSSGLSSHSDEPSRPGSDSNQQYLNPDPDTSSTLPPWHGLGRAGILEEACDASGTCSQDGQTFKSIFFHHLTLFCAPLPLTAVAPGKTAAADPEVRSLHRQSCMAYAAWVARNARAALATRRDGKFGMWWGAKWTSEERRIPDGTMDLRNEGEQTRGSADGSMAGRLDWDVNDRGRGRTVETQGGGVAVLRSMWEFIRMFKDSE